MLIKEELWLSTYGSRLSIDFGEKMRITGIEIFMKKKKDELT